MQTFMPVNGFVNSAQVLDYRRLGKQRVEALQILRTLLGESKGWANHPAVKMWKGHEGSLIFYGYVMCQEWKRRGYKDTCEQKFLSYRNHRTAKNICPPKWCGNEEFHASHRSNLLRKDPVWYGQFGWKEPDNLPYYWPTKEKKV